MSKRYVNVSPNQPEKVGVKDKQVYKLIDRLLSSDWRLTSTSDYYSLKSLLKDYSNPLSNIVLSDALRVQSNPSIFTFS